MANQNISDFLHSFAVELDVQDELKGILSNPSLASIELPEAFTSKLTDLRKNSMSFDTAINDANVSKHFKTKYLKTIESKLKKSLLTGGVSEEDIDTFFEDSDIYKNIDSIFPKFGDKIKSNIKPDKSSDETVKKYNDLVTEFNSYKELSSKKELELVNGFENERVNQDLNLHINAYKFDPSHDVDDVKFLINKKLNDTPYVFKRVEGKTSVFQKENPDLVATKNNKPLTPKDVIDEIASKYIAKTEATPAGTKTTPEKVIVQGQGTNPVNRNAQLASEKNKASLNAMKA